MKLMALALIVALAGCGPKLECRKWTVKEDVLSVYPYIVGPVAHCEVWAVKESK